MNRNLFGKIKDLKDRFIVTIVDKSANNFGFMCKHFLKHLMLEEYNINTTYIKLDINKEELDNRITAFGKRFKYKISSLKYPYLFPTIKFHKNPVKFRFVTCSTNCYNSLFSKKFFGFLKIILGKIKQIIIISL